MGTLERRTREKDAKRRRILRAAIRCFARSGYDATSLDDVARAAEVAKGTVYLYFKSKADLFGSLLLRHGFEPFAAELESRLLGCRDARGALRAFAGCFHDLCLAAERELFELFVRFDRGDLDRGLSDELRAETRERLRKLLAEIAAVVDRGRAAGEIHAPEGRRVAPVLWALCIGVAHLAKGKPEAGGAVHARQVLEDALTCLLDGIARPAGTQRTERRDRTGRTDRTMRGGAPVKRGRVAVRISNSK
ncbi:MAG: TetR/AcrR family transcriptional regulator [Planctomycetes bacterium]|nr:TetR/AcrR family transcriptional regulator [Planctomycetota bacterium]